MSIVNPQIFKRPVKGPCIFCFRENVPFNEEHLSPESIVGDKAVVLKDWVCQECNGKFSIEDKYFASQYHTAIGRVVYGIRGKKRNGAEVARKDIWGKFQPDINTVQLLIKTEKTKEDLLRELDPLTTRETTELEIENRIVNTRRLGRCLAKIALETVACNASEAALEPQFDPIRKYALGLGPLKFLPFALGNLEGRIGVALSDIKFDDSNKRVMVSLLFLPGAAYAIQLSDHDDLHPLWHVSKFLNMTFDEDGKRTRNFVLNVNLNFQPMESTSVS